MKKKSAKNGLPCAHAGLTTLLGLGVASSAHGIITVSTNSAELRPPATFGTVDWDIDDDGTLDFKLLNQNFTAYSIFAGAHILAQYNGRIMGATNSGNLTHSRPFANVALSQIISGSPAGYGFATGTNTVALTNGYGNLTFSATAQGWSKDTPGYIGFKFTNASGTHYGWASVTIDGTPAGSGFIINEAYYETDADTPIPVGAMPEPGETAVGLAGLALGAAALRRWRKRKQTA